jgi:hypothetical protein
VRGNTSDPINKDEGSGEEGRRGRNKKVKGEEGKVER